MRQASYTEFNCYRFVVISVLLKCTVAEVLCNITSCLLIFVTIVVHSLGGLISFTFRP